jgi:hypothetical protein
MPGKGFSTKLLVAGFVLATAVLAAVLWITSATSFSAQKKVLPDGSVLILSDISFAGRKAFMHGGQLEKILGNAIPSNGIAWSRFKLARPTPRQFSPPKGKSWLIAEFKLVGTNAQTHPLVSPAFHHQFRCVIHGDSGIDYVHEFWAGQFINHADGYFGYVVASRYPRDAAWLWLNIESRASQSAGGPWSPVAEFQITNQTPPPRAMPSTSLVTNVKVGDLSLSLDGITVVTQAFLKNDMWNHVVTPRFQIASNGLPLDDWDQPYVRVEDSSGNWDYNLASHRSLDPRYVWKVEADFEPATNFPEASVLKMPLPKPGTTLTTNVANTPVTISWNSQWLEASIPTNRSDVAIRFRSVEDGQGETLSGMGSWEQYSFRRGAFMQRIIGWPPMIQVQPKTLTLAIVTNVHATFYVQPVLQIRSPEK